MNIPPQQIAAAYIGIDKQHTNYVVVRQSGQRETQSTQIFENEGALLQWITTQKREITRVVCSFDPNILSETLRRSLTKIGVVCHLILP